jgi:hypothetical protein
VCLENTPILLPPWSCLILYLCLPLPGIPGILASHEKLVAW